MSKEDEISLFVVTFPFVDVGLAIRFRLVRRLHLRSMKLTSRRRVAAVLSQYRNATEELYS